MKLAPLRFWRGAALLLPLLLVGLFTAISGCEDEGGQSFTFLVISDPHVRLPGLPDAVAGDAEVNNANLNYMIDRINRDYPDCAFLIVTGDLVGNLYSDDPADYLVDEENPAEEFTSIMSRLRIPWYAALGNHDYLAGYDSLLGEETTDDPDSMEAVWEKVLGKPSYYSFVYGHWRFVIMNSARNLGGGDNVSAALSSPGVTGSFDDAQLNWLENLLQNPEPCLLFFHHPLITDNNTEAGWTFGVESFQVIAGDRFYEIARKYSNRIKGIFVGHGHVWTRDTLHDVIPVYETGSLGDALGDRDNVHIVTAMWDEEFYSVSKGNAAATYIH